MDKSAIEEAREFLKDSSRLRIDFSQTDQNRGVPPPPIEKTPAADAVRIPLVKRDDWHTIRKIDLEAAIQNRRSRRDYSDQGMTLEELSFLLWATQGIQHLFGNHASLRTVPSAGARHALETYVAAQRLEALDRGLYRYLPIEHELVLEYRDDDLGCKLAQAALGQTFVATAAATLIWTAIPYRMEWRYGLAAHKVIALDAGHVCQNLYLACEALSAGTCAIAAYHQEKMDALLHVDGTEEFTIYLAPVGMLEPY
jgi:SagB-type dehydrogenase family enzyme